MSDIAVHGALWESFRIHHVSVQRVPFHTGSTGITERSSLSPVAQPVSQELSQPYIPDDYIKNAIGSLFSRSPGQSQTTNHNPILH